MKKQNKQPLEIKTMTYDEYDRIKTEISKLTMKQKLILKKMNNNDNDKDYKDGTDSLLYQLASTNEQILNYNQKIKYVKLIDNPENIMGIVNINDIVKLQLDFGDEDIEEGIYKLISGGNPNMDDGITEITIKTSLGKAIYQKKPGDYIQFQTPMGNASAYIENVWTDEEYNRLVNNDSENIYTKKI